MAKPSLPKSDFKRFVPLLVFLPVGLFGGMLIGYLIAMKASSAVVRGDGLSSFAVFVIALIILLAHVVIHEAGHLVFGLMSGYRFLSFRIGSLMLVKDDGRLRLKTLSIAGTGGQCIMIPPEWRESGFPYALYNLGGALMNLLTAALGMLLWALIAYHPVWSTILMLFSAVGLANGLLNAIPMRFAMVDNDGSNVRMMKKDPQAVYAFYQMLHINAQVASGQRLRDLPEVWFTRPDSQDQTNPLIMTIEVFAVNRLMDQAKFDEASSRISALLRSNAPIAGVHRGLLRCDLAFCAMLRGDRLSVTAELDATLRKFMQSMRRFPSVLRTQFAEALLCNLDQAAAEKFRQQFERVAKNYPYLSDIESERDLMRAAQMKSELAPTDHLA